MTDVVAGKIRLLNTSSEPRIIRRNEHFCQARATISSEECLPDIGPTNNYAEYNSSARSVANAVSPTNVKAKVNVHHSDPIKVDPDGILPPQFQTKFVQLLREFDHVFDSKFKGYNGAVGPFQAVVNMGPVLPPQRKGRVPQYARGMLQELQQKFDELEAFVYFSAQKILAS